MSKPFYIIESKGEVVPIIISIPHCGVEFPEDIKNTYLETQLKTLDDTDWFLQDLYSFASDLGITIIHAKYHRWVIDLNRDIKSKPLYTDGRLITGLCPTTNFKGELIYKAAQEPTQAEIQRRLKTYFWTYYNKVQELLDERKRQFGEVLLWDAHSIRRNVPTIQKENFPDMILGDNDKKTASDKLINVALESLKKGPYEVSHNYPFKGGHITRYFGSKLTKINALQLEMNKILYMDDKELKYNKKRAKNVQNVLKKMFENLIESLRS
ncbi:MAG TPA: N-formylglutamate deformylase [Crocinitomix sp.]|nr:N-formylglutamate deformylase [Crocinitomix sp.]